MTLRAATTLTLLATAHGHAAVVHPPCRNAIDGTTSPWTEGVDRHKVPFGGEGPQWCPIAGGPPASPVPAIGSFKAGNCGHTTWTPLAECAANKATSGALHADTENITSLAECVAKVKTCSNANYVSYSSGNKDCSWFSHCDFMHLETPDPGAKYESEVLTGKDSEPSERLLSGRNGQACYW